MKPLAIAYAFRHRHPDAKPRIGSRAAADGHGIDRNGVAVGKGKSLIDIASETFGMIRAVVILLVENHSAVLADGDRAHVRAGIYVQNTRHDKKIVY